MTTRCDDCQTLDRTCPACTEAGEIRARAMWQAYCRSGLKPVYVPDRPDLVYADVWRGWQDWIAWSSAGANPPAAGVRAA